MARDLLRAKAMARPHVVPLTLLVAATGCSIGDSERAECPPDEACSPLLLGIRFQSPALTMHDGEYGAMYPTAVGGTQRVVLMERDLEGAGPLAFERPFTASVVGAAHAVAETGPDWVGVRALQPEPGLLRIVDPDTELLFDRVTVDAAALDRVELVPVTWHAWAADTAVAFYRDRASFGFRLWTADGRRLVDDSIVLELPTPAPTVRSWDWFELADAPVGRHAGLLRVAGTTVPFELHVVDRVDAITTFPAVLDGQPPGQLGQVCFTASLDGVTVMSVPWTFTATGPITLEGDDGAGCVLYDLDGVGAYSITGETVGGASYTVTNDGG